MQQVRAYKDGDQRWVIVIEGTDANLDDFVGNLVTGLAQGTIKPVEHLEKPAQMVAPEVDYAALEELKVVRPTPPKFVRDLQKEEEQVPSEDSKENEDPVTQPIEDPGMDLVSDGTEILRSNLGDRKLKELSFRMFHTADVGLVLRMKSRAEIKKLADRYEAVCNH